MIQRKSEKRDWCRCRFAYNKGTFGGGLFLALDHNVHPSRRNAYRVANAAFRENRVEVEGGAIYVTTTRTESDSGSLNAHSFLVLIEKSSFRQNT